MNPAPFPLIAYIKLLFVLASLESLETKKPTKDEFAKSSTNSGDAKDQNLNSHQKVVEAKVNKKNSKEDEFVTFGRHKVKMSTKVLWSITIISCLVSGTNATNNETVPVTVETTTTLPKISVTDEYHTLVVLQNISLTLILLLSLVNKLFWFYCRIGFLVSHMARYELFVNHLGLRPNGKPPQSNQNVSNNNQNHPPSYSGTNQTVKPNPVHAAEIIITLFALLDSVKGEEDKVTFEDLLSNSKVIIVLVVSGFILISLVFAFMSIFANTELNLSLTLILLYASLLPIKAYSYMKHGFSTWLVIKICTNCLAVAVYFKMAVSYIKRKIRKQSTFDWFQGYFDSADNGPFVIPKKSKFKTIFHLFKIFPKFRSDMIWIVILVAIFIFPQSVRCENTTNLILNNTNPQSVQKLSSTSRMTPAYVRSSMTNKVHKNLFPSVVDYVSTTKQRTSFLKPITKRPLSYAERAIMNERSDIVNASSAKPTLFPHTSTTGINDWSGFKDRWLDRLYKLDDYDFFKLMMLVWVFLLLFVLIFKFLKFKIFYKGVLIPVINDSDGYLAQIGNSSCWISPSGRVHATYCKTKSDEVDSCLRGEYATELVNNLSAISIHHTKNGDEENSSRVPRFRVHGILYQFFIFMVLSVTKVTGEKLDVIEFESYNPFMILIYISFFFLFVAMFFRTMLCISFSIILLDIAMLGIIITCDIDKTSRDLLIVSTSITLLMCIILLVYYIIHSIRKWKRPVVLSNQRVSPDFTPKTVKGLPKSTKQIRHRGNIFTMSTSPKGSTLSSIIFFILVLSLCFSFIEMSPMECHGLRDTPATQSCYKTYGEPYYDMVDMISYTNKVKHLYELMKNVTRIKVPGVSSVWSPGGHFCTKVDMKILANGTIMIGDKFYGWLSNLNMVFNDSATVPKVDWTLQQYYLDDTCPEKYIEYDNAEGYCTGTFCINKFDYLLLQEFAIRENPDKLFSDRPDTNINRIVGVYSYYSHTSEYCTHCVTLDSFNKYKNDTDQSIQNIIMGAKQLSSAFEGFANKTSVVELAMNTDIQSVSNYLNHLANEVGNFRFATRELNKMEFRMLGMKSIIDQATRQYNMFYQKVLNLMIDASGPQRPVLSKAQVFGIIEQKVRGIGYYVDDESVSMFLLKDVLIIKFLLVKQCPKPDISFSAHYCIVRSATQLYLSQNLILTYIFRDNLFNMEKLRPDKTASCIGKSCMFSYLTYERGVHVKLIGYNQIQVSNWSFSAKHDFKEVNFGLFRLDDSLLAVCHSPCKIYCDSFFVKEISNNIHIIQNCSQGAHIISNTQFAVATGPVGFLSFFVPTNLPIFYFPPEKDIPPYKNAPLKLKDLSSNITDTISFSRNYNDLFSAAQYFEANAANDTVDNGGVHTPDFIKGIGKVVKGIAGDAVDLVDDVASVPGKILSSTGLTLLPFILSGVALAIAIFWPIFLFKFMRHNQSNSASPNEEVNDGFEA